MRESNSRACYEAYFSVNAIRGLIFCFGLKYTFVSHEDLHEKRDLYRIVHVCTSMYVCISYYMSDACCIRLLYILEEGIMTHLRVSADLSEN